MTGTRPADVDRALQRLETALGPEAVRSPHAGRPQVEPQGREAARLAIGLLADSRVRWAPRGGGSWVSAWGDVELSTGGLADVHDLWRDDLVCRVGAGCRLEALQAVLAGERMRVPAAAGARQATLGGMFARGERGLRSGPAGGLREAVIGLTAVDGRGDLMKAGARVVKNVAGFDLARLHHGACGALGLVLDLTLKLEPVPETSACVLLKGGLEPSLASAARLRRPCTAIDPVVLTWLNGAAAAAAGLPPDGALIAVTEGWQSTVQTWVEQAQRIGAQPEDGLEARVRHLLDRDSTRGAWRWMVAPSVARRVWPAAEAALTRAGAEAWLLLDLPNGHAQLSTSLHGAPAGVAAALLELAAASADGDARLYCDRADAPTLRLLTAPRRAPDPVVTRLKHAFDPHGLLPALPQSIGTPS